jgi:hypothetical protein
MKVIGRTQSGVALVLYSSKMELVTRANGRRTNETERENIQGKMDIPMREITRITYNMARLLRFQKGEINMSEHLFRERKKVLEKCVTYLELPMKGIGSMSRNMARESLLPLKAISMRVIGSLIKRKESSM